MIDDLPTEPAYEADSPFRPKRVRFPTKPKTAPKAAPQGSTKGTQGSTHGSTQGSCRASSS